MNSIQQLAFRGNPNAYYLIKNLEEISESLNADFKGSVIDNLPPLENQENTYEIRGIGKVHSGDIIYRPIYKGINIVAFSHAVVIYGIPAGSKDLIIVEMTREEGMRESTFEKFQGTHRIDTIHFLRKRKDISLNEILARAKEWENKTYCFEFKNCQQFAFDVAYGQRYSPGIEFYQQGLLVVAEFLTAGLYFLKIKTWQPEIRKSLDRDIENLEWLKRKINSEKVASPKLTF